jgi:hypothetical protein
MKIGFGNRGSAIFLGQQATQTPKSIAILVELVCCAKHAAHGKCQNLFQECLFLIQSRPTPWLGERPILSFEVLLRDFGCLVKHHKPAAIAIHKDVRSKILAMANLA